MSTIIRMDYFTDPYCAWSWAFQPTLDALMALEGSALTVCYHQVPLLEDLKASGKSGEDVALAWEKIGRHTAMPIDASLWRHEPPKSTLPACRAAKAAAMQGAEGRFVAALRPFLMTQGRQADQETLLEAAREAQLDVLKFLHDQEAPEVEESLAADRALARSNAVGSTPSALLRNAQGDKVHIEGLRDLDLFKRSIQVLRVEEETSRLEESVRLRSTPLIREARKSKRR